MSLAAGRKRGERGTPSNGAIVWKGPSVIDGAPIVVLATSVRPRRSGAPNTKTGDVVATWILRDDVSPIDALRSHADVSVCGDCPLRPQGEGSGNRACYVHIGMVENLWDSYKDGLYPELAAYGPRPFEGRTVRLGAYGDPAAVPYDVWRELIKHSSGWRGYTHQWRSCDQRFAEIVQASCDTPDDLIEARATGIWRGFRTRLADEPLRPDEVVCPASAEAGKKTTCEQCQLCNGADTRGEARPDVAIVAHGWYPGLVAYHNLRGAKPPPSPRLKSRLVVV